MLDLLTWESQTRADDPAFEPLRDAIDALARARAGLASGLSLRLLHDTHRRLLPAAPAEVRSVQTETPAFVPPPPAMLPGVLGALETYLNAQDAMPPLLRAGLVFAQLETIQPYLDGNGRMGTELAK